MHASSEQKSSLELHFGRNKAIFLSNPISRYISAISNTARAKISAISNAPPETYPIARYADSPYQLHPLTAIGEGRHGTRRTRCCKPVCTGSGLGRTGGTHGAKGRRRMNDMRTTRAERGPWRSRTALECTTSGGCRGSRNEYLLDGLAPDVGGRGEQTLPSTCTMKAGQSVSGMYNTQPATPPRPPRHNPSPLGPGTPVFAAWRGTPQESLDG